MSLFNALKSFYRHRDLIFQFTRREIEMRHKASRLGHLWALITPLLMLCLGVNSISDCPNLRHILRQKGPHGVYGHHVGGRRVEHGLVVGVPASSVLVHLDHVVVQAQAEVRAHHRVSPEQPGEVLARPE